MKCEFLLPFRLGPHMEPTLNQLNLGHTVTLDFTIFILLCYNTQVSATTYFTPIVGRVITYHCSILKLNEGN